MREILFKAKRLDNGEWVQGYLTKMWGTFHIVDEHNENLAHPIDPETVCQFTGLTDKNGVKIFEGDVVKCRHTIFNIDREKFEDKKIRRSYGKEIEEDDYFGFNCKYWRNYAVSIYDGGVRIQNGADIHYIRKNYIHNHAIEIIGNIFDNPELMKGGVADD